MAKKEKLIIGALALIALVALYITAVLTVWVFLSGRVYPGVSVAGVTLAGKDKNEALKILESQIKKDSAISFGETKLESEKLKLTYDYEKTLEHALSLGQNNPFMLGRKVNVPFEVQFDAVYLYQEFQKKESTSLKAVQNPQIIKKGEDIDLTEGGNGVRLNYAKTQAAFLTAAGMRNNEFAPVFYSVEPTWNKRDFDSQRAALQRLIPQDFTLVAADGEYKITEEEILSWMVLPSQNQSLVKRFQGESLLRPLFAGASSGYFNEEAIQAYLDTLSQKINRAPQNAVLAGKDGGIVIEKQELNGRELNIPKSTQLISSALIQKEETVKLEVEIKKAEIRADNFEELGLKELVSTGYSNFAGSPNNRIHNIRVGAAKFNGYIIKPKEVFSFTKNLGEVDAANGYLPELVIKENTTTPEYGGGLCQVSSTAFRVALNAGLPIVARKAHSYPVSYYKPYGTDATIYIPNPDLKFTNDTGGHILIQTKIVGKQLFFEFYGTKKPISLKFAGNKLAAGGVELVEKVTPATYAHGERGPGSFKAIFYRFIYDASGKLLEQKEFFSNYDSPDKYPH